MAKLDFELLDQTFDEQQTALTTIANSIEFLLNIRVTQKRQIATARQAIAKLEGELEKAESLIDLQHRTIEALEKELSDLKSCPLHRFKAWVGTFKRPVAMETNHDEA